MEHIFNEKVYYADTDAYGVVWHGAYLRWMEKGRVLFCEQLGLDLTKLYKQDIALPLTNLNVKYKASAHLNDEVTITTKIIKKSMLSVTFYQTVSDKETGKVYVQAEIDVVSVSNSGKLYRRFPEVLNNAFKDDIICSA